MTPTSTNNSISIFKDGKLKPGIYKIQNIVSQTYVDIREHTRELCGRPATLLEGGGLWEILPSGSGYTIGRLEPGKPEQFCIMLSGLKNESIISVATFPVAWRVEIVHDGDYRGREYVRFFWGSTDMTWDLKDYGSDKDHTPVQLLNVCGFKPAKTWKLTPVKLGAVSQSSVSETTSTPTPGSNLLPPYDGNPVSQRCTCSHQTTETSDDELGTTVVEVTVTTTTKRIRNRILSSNVK
ncbi:hypothetical protein BDM02DRAFT_3187334 [Thelephora ganbajun]|uniref:Uncharacterized protein n=1 Tax=Thelephora ganbajun TaxID=370292 RepID=A0ACB6ZFF9_THEGA|nr:hypothetical protein BDM02DRAFT_3187334 [Thelephora ganbajun]